MIPDRPVHGFQKPDNKKNLKKEFGAEYHSYTCVETCQFSTRMNR
jgi:hypothetical protein